MLNVITKNGVFPTDSNFCVSLATEKVAEMAAGDAPASDLWARVVEEETGYLHYSLWFENGMLQTWCAETGDTDESILFL